MRTFLLFPLLFGLLLMTSQCKKDTETITETITLTDTVTVVDTLENFIPLDSGTVLFLVRHAETTGGGTDPHLSTAGLDRADRLAGMLQKNSLAAVYSTNFFRTMETAAPTSTAFGLTTTNYNSANMTTVANQLLDDHKGEKILVVGHSNTTPQLLNALLNTSSWTTFNDTVYDNFFVVFKSDLDGTVTHLKF